MAVGLFHKKTGATTLIFQQVGAELSTSAFVHNAPGNDSKPGTMRLVSKTGNTILVRPTSTDVEWHAARYLVRRVELALVLSVLFDCLAKGELWGWDSIVAQYIKFYEIPVDRIRMGLETKEYTIKGFRAALTRLTR